MFHHLPGLFSRDEVTRLRELAESARFVDGRATNRGHPAKRNLQLPQEDEASEAPSALVREGLARSPEVHAIVQPKRLARATLSRYEPGMEYGGHMDEAIFRSQPPMRADVSCTVFISDPDAYEGGELIVEAGNQQVSAKYPAGDAVLYPSTSIHRVAPVTRGVRLVAVSWFESTVRDAGQRDILYHLQKVLDDPRLHELDPELAVRVSYAKTNLLRMWADV
jgi:PKHD-type hydroxylase